MVYELVWLFLMTAYKPVCFQCTAENITSVKIKVQLFTENTTVQTTGLSPSFKTIN